MPYGTYRYVFNALTHTTPQDTEYLSGLLHAQQVPARFDLSAHRRRGAWGTTVPPGVFDNDFRPGVAWGQHTASRDRVTTLAAAQLPRGRRPVAHNHDVLEHGGQLYYHPEALRVYARHVEHGAFLLALARFLEAAEDKPELVVPHKTRTPYVPRERRGPVRGPSWTPDEDSVLRRWFGPRTVGDLPGRHQPLTDAEWAVVLAQLPMRNKGGVRDRLVELNRPLQAEFMRHGFVALDRLPAYMSRVLGERPRAPVRPARRRRRL